MTSDIELSRRDPSGSLAVCEVSVLSLILSAAIAGVPEPPPFQSYAVDFERQGSDVCFPSGLRVTILRDDRQPVIALTTVIDAGSASDPVGREGAAHLLEHLWFRSTPTGRPVAHVLDDLGAVHNAWTLADTTVYATVADVAVTRDLLGREPGCGVDSGGLSRRTAVHRRIRSHSRSRAMRTASDG